MQLVTTHDSVTEHNKCISSRQNHILILALIQKKIAIGVADHILVKRNTTTVSHAN